VRSQLRPLFHSASYLNGGVSARPAVRQHE
jgi:hypothetical protein